MNPAVSRVLIPPPRRATVRLQTPRTRPHAPTNSPVTAQSAPSLLPVCSQSASSLLPVCSQSAPSLLPVCSQSASSLLPVCFQSAPSLLPVCSQSASSLLPVCFQSASSMATSLLQAMEISASQFLDIFHHYDNDGNGFIEGRELQSFIRELRDARQQMGLDLTDEMRQFVSECEMNSDRRIGLVELVQILPTEENFLLFFRQQLSSCSHFIQAWRRYDADHSGYIEADELKSFLNDLLLKAQRTCDDNKLDEYTAATLKIFDSNGDGKLCLSELARLLPDEQNFLLRFQGVKMSKHQFNRIFDLYDQDARGFIDESELDALLRDLCEKDNQAVDSDLHLSSIMELSDGGRLYRSDLILLLCDED